MTSKTRTVIQSQGLSLEEVRVVTTVDVKGQVCPYPAFESMRALSPLSKDDILEVLTDNELSALDSIPTLCKRRDLQYLVEKEEDFWRVYIKK